MDSQKTDVGHIEPTVVDENDAEREARVFRELDARREAWEKQANNSIVILKSPDCRSLKERLRAWWFSRSQGKLSKFELRDRVLKEEPEWENHWKTSKYL